MKQIFAVACLLLSACGQQAQQIEITWAGLYQAEGVSPTIQPDGVAAQEIANVRLLKSTTTVPAKPGLRFGVSYRAKGAPTGTTMEFKRRMHFPAPGAIIAPGTSPLPHSDVTIRCEVGVNCMTGFGFDHPWELMPGLWTIEIWSGANKLVEQRFTVVAQ